MNLPTELKDPQAWSAAELHRAKVLAERLRQPSSAATRLIAARAPGRANLIGEHTDYSGLPVLPAAIDRVTIIVAAARHDQLVELSNLDAAYQPRTYRLEKNLPPFAGGDWANYHKAALQALIAKFPHRFDQLRGLTAIVDGRVPPAAGLSSSAALTVASALSFMALNELELSPIELAATVASGERYVGTLAGGMDQTVSVMGRREHAIFIQFNPLRARPVPIPAGAALIVADSLEIADKSGAVRNEYNRRVVECSLAARLLAKALNLPPCKILGEVVGALPGWQAHDLLETLAAAAPAALSGIAQAATLLATTEAALRRDLLGAQAQIALDERRPLEILRRARHVLGETERVMKAVAVLESNDLDALGELIDASHHSLATDFDVSTPSLDRLVQYARAAGAQGARLTGAGFGGSIIALCRSELAPSIVAALDRDYYAGLGKAVDLIQARAVFRAGAGASAIDI